MIINDKVAKKFGEVMNKYDTLPKEAQEEIDAVSTVMATVGWNTAVDAFAKAACVMLGVVAISVGTTIGVMKYKKWKKDQ